MKVTQCTFLFALLITSFAPSAEAQHIFLDMNGDGISTAVDVLGPGTTTADVWLITNRNPDGSFAGCNTGCDDLTINSYDFILRSSSGTRTWGTYTCLLFGS